MSRPMTQKEIAADTCKGCGWPHQACLCEEDFDEYEEEDDYCNCGAMHDDTELGGLCSACGGIVD